MGSRSVSESAGGREANPYFYVTLLSMSIYAEDVEKGSLKFYRFFAQSRQRVPGWQNYGLVMAARDHGAIASLIVAGETLSL